GKLLAARFQAGSKQRSAKITLAVNEREARYPITIDPFVQQAYLKASNSESNDAFGLVAISGDTVVVATAAEDSNATGVNGTQANNSSFGAGAAYVFVRSGTTWTQQAYLKASNTEPTSPSGTPDSFGLMVALDGNTAVVMAPYEDSDGVGVNGTQTNNNADN